MSSSHRSTRVTLSQTLIFALLAIVSLLLSGTTRAEQMQQLGRWDVHYQAFPSTFITADVAAEYGIKRSKYLGLINISVLDNESQQAQGVTVTVSARNLLGNVRELKVREIREQHAIYYIAEVPHRNEETYRFTVTLASATSSEELQFQHKFYVD